MPAPKGKQGTKGQKQIIEENKQTLKFYQIVIGGVNVLYLLIQYAFFWDQFTTGPIVMFVLALMTYFGSYQFMGSIARGCLDLNMESGMAEHSKDLLLLTAIVQMASLISNYFWMLWLLAPGRAIYMLWVNILSPWFFEAAPEVDEKKQKKMERKLKRHH